jgi:hypothetical protein
VSELRLASQESQSLAASDSSTVAARVPRQRRWTVGKPSARLSRRDAQRGGGLPKATLLRNFAHPFWRRLESLGQSATSRKQRTACWAPIRRDPC